MEWLTAENIGYAGGILAAAVLLFDRLAKLFPTLNRNGEVSKAYKVLAILGVKVKDRT